MTATATETCWHVSYYPQSRPSYLAIHHQYPENCVTKLEGAHNKQEMGVAKPPVLDEARQGRSLDSTCKNRIPTNLPLLQILININWEKTTVDNPTKF